MDTPIFDFARSYAGSGTARFHMPGHKGRGDMGWEALDLTEIRGADSLYEADGIIARSEENAAALFGTGRTFYAAGGSSQCLKAMMALIRRPKGRTVILAARNAHKAFLQGAGLLDYDVRWLWPEGDYQLLRCPVGPEGLDKALRAMDPLPAAVFVTSPDYLGYVQPIGVLAAVCRTHGVPLLVDNAHGAYLHFLEEPCHPMDLGADLCCDSGHKTLPVLTGGAYLHLSPSAAERYAPRARQALSLFGSTSPSYLILESLDRCNAFLAGEGPARIRQAVRRTEAAKKFLRRFGWRILEGEPLKIVAEAADGMPGTALADLLRSAGVECEYADPDHLVLMTGPGNTEEEFARLERAFPPSPGAAATAKLTLPPPRQALSIREALLAPWEEVPVEEAIGRICAAPAVSCPPAVAAVVCGEVVSAQAAQILSYYNISSVAVVSEG